MILVVVSEFAVILIIDMVRLNHRIIVILLKCSCAFTLESEVILNLKVMPCPRKSRGVEALLA